MNGLERQLVVVPSPCALRLTLEEDADGPALGVIPQGTFLQPEKIAEMLELAPPERWRHPKKPVLSLRLPFFIVTDEPNCWMSLLPPFFEAAMRRWPGAMVAGRLPLSIWPQSLSWSFEWDRPDQELHIKQGEPLAYALFEFDDPAKRPRLVEAALTEALAEYRAGMDAVHEITPDIEGIWASAAARRPARLLEPLDPEAAAAAGGESHG